jgi:hypothetical protein
LGDDDVADVAGPELDDDEAVLWVAVPMLEVVLELDDPPHAATSRTSELIPVATAHRLLRITSLLAGRPGVAGSLRDLLAPYVP